MAAGLVYLFLLAPGPSPDSVDTLMLARRVVVASMVTSVVLFGLYIVWPTPSVLRRLLGIAHDVSFLSAVLLIGGDVSAPFAGLYLLIALGNGFRYGTPYLYFSATLSIVAFAIVHFVSDYWLQQGTLSFNIFMMLTIVPFYAAVLLSSLHRARDQLKQQAARDALTGLLSRSEFESIVDDLMTRDPLGHALLYCDLDRFKSVNDMAGHAAGDKLLADVGAIIGRCARASDASARTGGDEFCVLLRNCSPDRAREIAEQIRSKVAGYRLAWGREYFSVGVSIGIAPTSAVSDAASLFRLADAACYAAKNAGRNQIHVVDPRVDSLDTGQVRRLFIDDIEQRRDVTAETRKK